MIQFQFPELLLLAIPAGFVFFRWGWVKGVTGWLRLATLVCLLLALAGPEVNLGGRGLDVIVVADRSYSMPAGSGKSLEELIENLERNRGPGDRVALVSVGSEAQIEHTLSKTSVFDQFTKVINHDGSDLHGGVMQALALVNPNRPARILMLSDGEANGASPLSAARRAREMQVPVDYRLYERLRVGDVAVESVLVPDTVSPREPFQFSVWVYADRETVGTVKVLRDGKEIASKQSRLSTGMNRLIFRDLLEQGGFFRYEAVLQVANDPLIENNVGAGVVRVDAGPKVLVLNSDGSTDTNFTRAIQGARIPFDVQAAKEHPLTQDALDQYRAVILENVPAGDLGRLKMERLTQFVEDLGGGLLLTGGERSFGTGGYFKSPLDDILPVSMELREEHRKHRIAIAIALDRSGSMMAPVAGGKTKMDLANLGTAECIQLLSPADMVSVIAVDSAPHIIQEMTKVDNPASLVSKVKRIESMGGGIYVYEALVAAGQQLMKAGDYSTRHIILFSDAQDSEEPGDYQELLAKFEKVGITVSVIGMGTKTDVDAKLLEDVAKRGNGNIMFTNDPMELPRLFTEDTMSVARSSFIKADEEQFPNGIPGAMLPDVRLIGDFSPGAFPKVGGYNLTYLKPDATQGAISQDEYGAPFTAFWYRGLGRVGALTLEVDGQYSGQFGRWEDYEDFLVTHVRWLLGGKNPNEVYVNLERSGQDAIVTVELDPDRPNQDLTQAPELRVIPPGDERQDVLKPVFYWTGPHTLQARFLMNQLGTYRTLVQTSQREFTKGPALTLPYSPEHVPRIGLDPGQKILEDMAGISGGVPRTDVLEIFQDPPRSAETRSLLPWLAGLGIFLVLLEIAGRRLSLWEWLREPRTAAQTVTEPGRKAGWLPRWKLRLPQRKPKPVSSPTISPGPAAVPKKLEPAAPTLPKSNPFDQAKKRARRRTGD